MSRKGKKGFHRLENHELTDFTSLQRGSDSGSEVELDLRPQSDRDDARYDGGGRNSLCCWLMGLYLAVLTILFIVMTVCTAYVALNYMDSQRDMLEAHDEINRKIDALQSKLDKASRTWTNQFAAAMLTISLNNASATQEFGRLGAELGELELWAAAIEGKPEEKLIKELEQKMAALNKSMGVLNKNTALLNRSLGDVQEIKTRMASLKSVLDSYDARLGEIHRTLGDLTHKDTQLEGRVDPLSSDVAVVKGSLQRVQDSMSKSHETFDQSLELLTSQFQNLQLMLSALNHSTVEGVEELREDVYQQRHRVESLTGNMTTARGEMDSLTSQVGDILVTLSSEPSTEATQSSSQPTSTTPSGSVAEPTTMVPVLNQTNHTHSEGFTDEGTTELSTPTPAQNQTVPPTSTSAATGEEGVTATTPPTQPQTDLTSDATTDITELPTGNSSAQAPTEAGEGAHTSGSGGSSQSTGATEDVPNGSGGGGGGEGGGGEGGEGESVAGDSKDNSSISVSSSTGTPSPPESTSATEDSPSKEVNQTLSSTTDSIPNGGSAVGNDSAVTNLTAPSPSTATPSRTSGTDGLSPGEEPSGVPTPRGEVDKENLRNGIAALEGLLQGFDQLDLDKDGFLNWSEFTRKFPDAQKLFSSLDTNGDKKLSAQELRGTLAFLREQLGDVSEPEVGVESGS